MSIYGLLDFSGQITDIKFKLALDMISHNIFTSTYVCTRIWTFAYCFQLYFEEIMNMSTQFIEMNKKTQ